MRRSGGGSAFERESELVGCFCFFLVGVPEVILLSEFCLDIFLM